MGLPSEIAARREFHAHEAYISFDHEADDSDDERRPWELVIPSPDGKPYVRTAWSPEPLVRAALKWARDRNIGITVIIWSVA